jgi:Flp pilus assembly pilin Flp
MRRAHKGAFSTKREAQAAIEYMLLLGVVAAAVLVAFKISLVRPRTAANAYFNQTVVDLWGAPNRCGDGTCSIPFESVGTCPLDCS